MGAVWLAFFVLIFLGGQICSLEPGRSVDARGGHVMEKKNSA
jgi:hypothetical protein